MRTALVAALLVAGVGASGCSAKGGDHKVRVAAAADLARAFTELATEFKTRTGITLEMEFGSSGLLAKQIEEGAPFSLLAAANISYVDQVIKAGRCDANTARSYARGRIVVWTPNGVTAPASLEELADPRFRKIAIANPEHAPYGRAAKQALQKSGVWPKIADRIVLGDNIQATMLYARNHNADAAIVALSLAVVDDGGTSLPIDPTMHAPLEQAMVVCGTGDDAKAAQQFATFVASKEGREVMTRYGFLLPDEQLRSQQP
ncbi:MAG TPA: molybdate ABC transporter substrate-binding protein [Kofleriaceae bacterium]|jgi:molybdate transport system substrate-binding protein|nr:molybdate ABC transporter substrate-binding protein [Kofleriaceae bacterium]